MEFKFEDIDTWNQRAKVPGGWIVKTTEPVYHSADFDGNSGDGWDWRISTCFVPDEGYYWKIDP